MTRSPWSLRPIMSTRAARERVPGQELRGQNQTQLKTLPHYASGVLLYQAHLQKPFMQREGCTWALAGGEACMVKELGSTW